MPRRPKRETESTNMTLESNQTPSNKQPRSQTIGAPGAKNREERGVMSAARKLGRAVARLAKPESEVRRDQGIDYATFHALYSPPLDDSESSNDSLSFGASSSTHKLPTSQECGSPSIYSYSRGRSFDATSTPVRFGYSTDSLPSSPSSTRTAQRRIKFAKLTRHLNESNPADLGSDSCCSGTPHHSSSEFSPPKPRRRLMPLSRTSRFPPPVEYKVPESDTSEFSEASFGRWNATRPKLGTAFPQITKSKPRPRNIEIVVTLQSQSTECFSIGTEENVPPVPPLPASPSDHGVYYPNFAQCDKGKKPGSIKSMSAKVYKETPTLDPSGIPVTHTVAKDPLTQGYFPDRQACSSPAPTFVSQGSDLSVYYSDMGDTLDEHEFPLSSAPNGTISPAVDSTFNINDHAHALNSLHDQNPSILTNNVPSWREHWRRTEKLSQFFGVDLNTLGASCPVLPTIGEAL